VLQIGNALVRRIRAGMVFWNCYHCVDIAAPFGGFKMSGIGREGGPYGVQSYLEVPY
jgi:acyl-CoA reductase-like NAD-dependent aldehyde dehydrogenase